MPPKKPRILIYLGIAATLVFFGLAGWFFVMGRSLEAAPQLTPEAALAVLRIAPSDCLSFGPRDSYGSCKIELFKEIEGSGWIVLVTYDGLRDDSVAASRREAYLMYQDGTWVVGNVVMTQKCWPGRGHQDFSAELCT